MKLIVGLGNPGKKYENTRHNVGFDVTVMLAGPLGCVPPAEDKKSFIAKLLDRGLFVSRQFDGETIEGYLDGQKIIVLCPTTYMNESGRSVRKAIDFYKLEPSDLLVICDDMNLPLGKIRIRGSGSAGGQKGLADIIRHLGHSDIPRLRIGVDRPPDAVSVTNHVLGKFRPGEKNIIDDALHRAMLAACDWAQNGISHCMNHFNG
ncbi:MAG: aminoacyl-tRNA hydrolase [Planctomycetota bacterium]